MMNQITEVLPVATAAQSNGMVANVAATTPARTAVTSAVLTSGFSVPNTVGRRAKAKPHWQIAITQSCHIPQPS